MKNVTLDELRELAPGFVMGTLTPDELGAFNAAIADADMWTALEPEIVAHRLAAEFLATDNVVVPPPALRQRVIDRIATERGAPLSLANTVEFSSVPADVRSDVSRAATPSGRPSATPSASQRATPKAASAGSTDMLAARRAVRVTPPHTSAVAQRSTRPAWITAGVLGLAMAASLFFALNLKTRVGVLDTLVSQQQRAAQLLSDRLADREKTINALTSTDNDLKVVRLVANENAGPSMRVFWNQRTGEAVVRAANFAQIPDTRTYVLWMIRDGKPESLQLFTPDAAGESLISTVVLPRDPAGIVAFAVTEEPAGGSPQPTMQPFLVGQVRGSSE